MGDGSRRPIEQVRVGDEVLSCYGSGDFRPARVMRAHRSTAPAGYAITTKSGRRVVSTAEHVHFAANGTSARLRPDVELDRRIVAPVRDGDGGF